MVGLYTEEGEKVLKKIKSMYMFLITVVMLSIVLSGRTWYIYYSVGKQYLASSPLSNLNHYNKLHNR
jgi:prolipoprotein diacylglyceryltransferase